MGLKLHYATGSAPCLHPVNLSAMQDGVEVLLRVGDGLEVIGVHKGLDNGLRKKSRHGGSETDIFDAQSEQREQNAHGLLLVPGQHKRERQVVDRAAEGVRESECNLDGAVGIVALSDVEDARDTVNLAEVKVIKAELAAREREDKCVHRCAFDELRVVVTPGVRTVTAADEKDVFDGASFDGLDDLWRLREDCRVGKAGGEHVTAVDAAHAAVGLIAAEGERLLDDRGEVLAALRIRLDMTQPPVANDRGGVDAVSVALTRRHDAVGGEKNGCGEIGKLLLLILPRRAEVAGEMGVFVQTRIAVRGQHLAVRIDVDGLSSGLLEELMQVLKVVTGYDDERSFLNIGVDARGHGIAEG